MPRFTDTELSRLKTEISLLSLIERQGYKVVKQGKDYALSCPFHSGDDTPSLIVSENNLFHCFGCDAAGSVIDWVMKTQGVSFRHAVEILKADIPSLAATDKPIKSSTVRKLDSLLNEDSEAQVLLNQVIDYYHETLKQSPEALDYLNRRGLGSMELIERFKIGYANRTLGYRLPAKQYKAGKLLRGKLQEVGIYRASGHEHFHGSIVVPLMNGTGNVVECYGRKLLGKRLTKGTPQHLYLPGQHTGVWNATGLEGCKEVILCESLFDAMTFWVAGYTNVTCSYGTSGFTDEHLVLFKELGIERVLIAYDRDSAGDTATNKLAVKLQAEGFGCYRIEFPQGMDANSYACEVDDASLSLGKLIRHALWMGDKQETQRLPELAIDVTTDAVIEPEKEVIIADALVTEADTNEWLPTAPASVLPKVADVVQAEVSDKDIRLTLGNRLYRVRGIEKNRNYEVLKVNIMVSIGSLLHVDSFDLYSAKTRQSFIKVAALELEVEDTVIKKDLGQLLLQLEILQEQQIETAIDDARAVPSLAADEVAKAMALLKDKQLLARILSDFEYCGVVGESVNKLVGYLASSSRKLDKPLAVMIQSTSAAGKSSLMDAILNLMPGHERVQYSAMTGQSLFYMGETNLKHKILAISEEAGAEQASYALKLLQSEGEITIASTGKDDTTGELVTREYRVEGPVMLFLTTTAIDIDEELMNRCLVLSVNESREQTKAIHDAQRKRRTLEGLQSKIEQQQLTHLHRNAQSLLRPLAVINPYADQLTFLDTKTRTRRDHEKYLTLIDSIALLHQYQREVKTLPCGDKSIEYIEATLDDIAVANMLAHEVLGRTLDELPPQTRKLLNMIKQMGDKSCKSLNMAQNDYRFSRRDIRDYTGWSDGQLKIHCARLTELEYLLVHRGGRGQQIVYELLFTGDDSGNSQMMGLIDIKKLGYDDNKLEGLLKKLGLSMNKSAPSQCQDSSKSTSVKSLTVSGDNVLPESSQAKSKSTYKDKMTNASHHSDSIEDMDEQVAYG